MSYISRRSFVGLFAAPLVMRAQDTTFSAGVNVVNVLATVRDKQGKIVTDLQKEDFLLSEDGRPQTIRYFSRETDLPLTLGLLVDTSLSQRKVLDEEKSASYRFIGKVLREDRDRAFVIHFDHETELLQDLTSSRREMEKAIDRVTLAEMSRLVRRSSDGSGSDTGRQRGDDPANDRYPTPSARGGRPAGTTLYDAVFLASDELMRRQTGRKAVILLTDGVDQGSRTSLHTAIEMAQRRDVLIYSILFAGEEPMMQGPPRGYGRRGMGGGYPRPAPPAMDRGDGRKVLQQMSRETGGGFFEVSKKLPLDEVYRRIDEELRSQYSIGYTPEKRDDTRYRDISLTTTQKALIVQTRTGYYPADR